MLMTIREMYAKRHAPCRKCGAQMFVCNVTDKATGVERLWGFCVVCEKVRKAKGAKQ